MDIVDTFLRSLRPTVRGLLVASPLGKALLPTYPYLFTPAQLAFLCDGLSKTHPLKGAILEIGCFRGNSTIYLKRHLLDLGDSRSYFAMDTFSGFTKASIAHETSSRNKKQQALQGFQVNRARWLEKAITLAKFENVRIIEADICNFDVNTIGPVSFCLIDVDLYLPVKAALEKVYPLLENDGIIVVDDCVQDAPFDGAYQAYSEFTRQNNLKERVEHGKLGVIQKLASQN